MNINHITSMPSHALSAKSAIRNTETEEQRSGENAKYVLNGERYIKYMGRTF
ncbi:hypothetical protein GCM10011409_39980 [Lentibacillus populi]|uniref:Uncharacterized protein n=1 Tax=Lentibacillus populi TaxID=1827502 RepID=A0A9W5U0T8_9BACI|nr:hypothetical protein GCM10011409_39980 [Lentibacillus populi]